MNSTKFYLNGGRKKVYEVYFRKHNRIFYVTVDKENIYLLHAFQKQKNKTEKNDAKIVKARAKEVGNLVGKEFIQEVNIMPFAEFNVKEEIEKRK